MEDLWVAIGLVLVIEGFMYALFPDHMKRMIITVLALPSDKIRAIGLVFAAVGLFIVWIIRGH